MNKHVIGTWVQVCDMKKKFYFTEGREYSITPTSDHVNTAGELKQIRDVIVKEDNSILYKLYGSNAEYTASMLKQVSSILVTRRDEKNRLIDITVEPEAYKRIRDRVTFKRFIFTK